MSDSIFKSIDELLNGTYTKLIFGTLCSILLGYTIGPLPEMLKTLIQGNDLYNYFVRGIIIFIAGLLTLNDRNPKTIITLIVLSIIIVIIFGLLRQGDMNLIDEKNKNKKL